MYAKTVLLASSARSYDPDYALLRRGGDSDDDETNMKEMSSDVNARVSFPNLMESNEVF